MERTGNIRRGNYDTERFSVTPGSPRLKKALILPEFI
jgi:hypothetical protein